MPLIINPDLMILDDGGADASVSTPAPTPTPTSTLQGLKEAEAASTTNTATTPTTTSTATTETPPAETTSSTTKSTSTTSATTKKTVDQMTPEELLVETAKQVAAGVTSTSDAALLPGENYQQANERLTAAYREMLAKPILTPEQEKAGGEVRYVRAGGAGRGEYRIVMPFGSTVKGEATEWTMGIIPSYSEYITGTTLGMWSNGDGTATAVGDVPVTTITKAGTTSTRYFPSQEEYYTVKVGTTGKTQAQLDAATEQEKALQLNKDIATLLGGTVDPATGKVINVSGKTVTSIVPNADGTTTVTASDGTTTTVRSPSSVTGATSTKTIKNVQTNPDGSTTYFYTDGTQTTVGGSNAPGTSGTSGGGNTFSTGTGSPTTNLDVLKATLRGLGFTSAIIDSSSSFLNSLLKEGLDYDNATEIFLNSKEYTLKNGQKITSPFYTEYGYLNEGLTVPKSANELFNTVEGYKGVVSKYNLSPKYLTQDALKQYVKNDVTVANLAERAGMAQLRATEADQFQVNALIKLGYIGSAADLTDFYMDSKLGQEQLELNRQTGVFTAEALRRAKSGISASAEQLSGFKQLTASLAAKGYNEAQISQLAGQGFENISQTLQPTTAFAQIYEKAGGTEASNAALTEDIQKSLLAEEFQGTASERRKRLAAQNVAAFQGSAGTNQTSLRTANVLGII